MASDRKPLDWDEIPNSAEGLTEAYCVLQGYVNEEMFGFAVASDCFCVQGEDRRARLNWSSDRQVYEFVRDAVQEKLDRRAKWLVTFKQEVLALDAAAAEAAALDKADREWDWESKVVEIERQMSL